MVLIIRRAKLRDTAQEMDIAIEHGRIKEVQSSIATTAETEINAEGKLVTPALVNAHLHLDKCLTGEWVRTTKEAVTMEDIIANAAAVKKKFTHEDIVSRATRCLRMALTYGTTIVRGFADVDNILGLMPVKAVLEVKRRLEQYMTLQVVAFPQEGIIHRDGVEELLWQAMEAGADVVGGIPFYEFTQEDAKKHIDKVFEIAKHFNKDIHVLADVDDDPNSKNLQYLAVKTQRERYEGRVAASYCTSLAYYHDTYARKVIELTAKANISVVSNPHLNLTATGRPDRQPLKRGLTRVRELINAGVNVTSGQDDVDDPYYPFGRADMLEVGHYMAHTAQMTSEAQIDAVYDMITRNGARALKIEDYGLQPGNRADLIVLDARSTIEAFRMMSERTYVISLGKIVAENSVARKVLVS